MRHTLVAIALTAALPLGAHAEDLLQVYRDARGYDAQYAAARYALEAGREKLPQGRALLLPTLNLSGSATDTRTDFESDNPAANPSFNAGRARLQRHNQLLAADLPQAELHPVRPGRVPGEAGRGELLAGQSGSHRARGAGLLRRARRAGHARAGGRAEGGDLGAAGAGQAQLRSGHRDHHRHARGAGALRPERGAGDPGAERPRREEAHAAADHGQGIRRAQAAAPRRRS